MRFGFALFTSLLGVASASSQDVPDRLLVGYWQNWPSSPNTLALTAVPEHYDVVNVSFAIPTVASGATMQFQPFQTAYPTTQAFASDVAALQARGQQVLISIGGANHPVVVDTPAAAQAFAASMLQIITTYGFDGVDIDLEGHSFAMQPGDVDFTNPTTPRVVHFISGLNQLLAQLPADFILSAAPETAMVQGAMSIYGGVWGSYLPLLHALRGRFDWVHVQHYNSGTMYGRDGQVYTPGTIDFHVAMADALLGGFTTVAGVAFQPLDPEQVLVGLPATTGAAGSGYTSAPLVHAALDRLILGASGAGYQLASPGGYPALRGLMTWSVNWDVYAGLSFSTPHREYLDHVFLQVDPAHLSVTSGSTATFSLTAGRANAGRDYLLLVGFSGTDPGTALPGGPVLPLNLDVLSSAVVDPVFGSVFVDFTGTLDATGVAAAQLTAPTVSALVGLELSFAYSMPPWDFASTSVCVSLTF